MKSKLILKLLIITMLGMGSILLRNALIPSVETAYEAYLLGSVFGGFLCVLSTVAIMLTMNYYNNLLRDKLPKNLWQCVKTLDNTKIPDLKDWLEMDEDKAAAHAHFTMGMWIRNNFKLFKENVLTKHFERLGYEHADDMSDLILRSFHRYKNGKQIKK